MQRCYAILVKSGWISVMIVKMLNVFCVECWVRHLVFVDRLVGSHCLVDLASGTRKKPNISIGGIPNP